MSWDIDKWPERTIEGFQDLQRHVTELLSGARESETLLAWRGLGKAKWTLSSTLDRLLEEIAPCEEEAACVKRELDMINEFRVRALVFADKQEALYLKGDLPGPGVWNVMALARHSGLPTRIVDWTLSPWVAAYFACIEEYKDNEEGESTSAICWFDQKQLESVVHKHWDEWGVPTRENAYDFSTVDPRWRQKLGLNERALEVTAFEPKGRRWISKIHYSLPFQRMEAQQGFMTACGRIRTDHNDAIDDLPGSEKIRRGRIIIPERFKDDVLSWLRHFNVTARGLQHPGIDIVARKITERVSKKP